ncbi:iron-sulfur cluster assembly scaffold protein [Amaricoccus solimangrovi]|uniref:Iron-sulfur cluster assembly scaffold protein n=1 Tax=Amaricoccus solimangrovi TaxID=2589815 RepID=A0A501WNQ7_9RHOB|nr:iron-sulfur cluster assembly scaffold protein [Amaricoccus solimangrovi]TPE50482.1 iron-sulfur cluster assembly scaffold protein [Amaricoccus solimangrovi]
MAEQDLIKLYSQRILALASDIPRAERLAAPGFSVRRRAPLCGSTVTVDLDLDAEGRIADFGQDVRACALGQASAALLAEHVIGCDRAAIQRLRDQLRAMLRDGGPVPGAPFDGYEVLVPARDYRNRHDSIMLAIEATLEAMDQAARAA